ncbi:unnamed protein product [Moneuplotes crassus]|uniref:LITAF domain-containing protein n=1 Tax=Euplotes crassus TaxID=5936 RepID=A0AAD1Y3M1_EUPCR|nr:unnamed protein product [Moneuplotes crassus]
MVGRNSCTTVGNPVVGRTIAVNPELPVQKQERGARMIVITTHGDVNSILRDSPNCMHCHNCRNVSYKRTYYEISPLQWILYIILFFFFPMCCFLPCYFTSLYTKRQVCSVCNVDVREY